MTERDNHEAGPAGAAKHAAAVTPNDSTDLAAPALLYVGGAGTVNVDTYGGETVDFPGMAAGTILPLLVKRVRSTGTTATNIRAIW